MSEIQQILEGIRVGFVDKVRQFRTKTSGLDLIHNEYVKKFVDSVWSLFDGPTRFEGKAADELKTLLGDYKYAEATQTGHGLNGDISQRLDQWRIFEQVQLCCRFRSVCALSRRTFCSAERCYWQYEYARTLFNQLKERGLTRLLFTGDLYDDLFQKFDEYEAG